MMAKFQTEVSIVFELDGGIIKLGQRHLDVLRCLANGHNNIQIAQELGLSTKTIKNYLSQIYTAFQVESRLQAVLFAQKHHILALNQISNYFGA